MDTLNTSNLDPVIIDPTLPLGEALAHLDQAGTGALALCFPGRKLVGLLTDGDIRRALLEGAALDTPCDQVATSNPILAGPTLSRRDALQLMVKREIDQLPVVNEAGELTEFLLRKALVAEESPGLGMAERLLRIMISPGESVAKAIAKLDSAGTGALVVSADGRKVAGLLSDGDIRRAVLRGISLDEPCGSIAMSDPFMVQHPLSNAEALQLMLERDINHLPVVDRDGNLFDFLLRRDLVGESSENLSAVIMAGGFGKRLMPLTQQLPKPMLPVGDKPLLQRTIEQLRRSGIREVNLTTHYLPDSIVQHFGDGDSFGVRLNYLKEDHPLGTAGGLRLMKKVSDSFLVMNGDILTGVPFQEMFAYHRKNGAEVTVGVRKYDVQVPFGVVECEDIRITKLKEKPSLTFFINAGIYLLEPSVFDLIPEDERFDMTDLIQKLLDEGRAVVSFPIMEYWLDVGRHEDYQQAQEDVMRGKIL